VPLRPGDQILTSRAEYGSNVLAYWQVASRTGAEVAVVPNDEHGQLDEAALARMASDRTRLIGSATCRLAAAWSSMTWHGSWTSTTISSFCRRVGRCSAVCLGAARPGPLIWRGANLAGHWPSLGRP
jgi:hypothetical protein